MLKYLSNTPSKPTSPPPPENDVPDAPVITPDDDVVNAPITGDLPPLDAEIDAVLSNPEPAQPPEDEVTEVAVLKQKLITYERRIANLERIVKVSQILNSTLSIAPLLQIIIQAATELTSTEACSIMLVDRDQNYLYFAEVTGGVNDAIRKLKIPMENSIGGWVVRTNRPFLIRDAKNDPRWNSQVDETIGFDTNSILGVPLQVREQIVGVLEVVNKQSEIGFTPDDIQIANLLATQAAIAIENARLLDELQRAYRDLSELDQVKSDFVNIAAHELRTPLAVILGYASFLRENLTGSASEQLQIVVRSAMKLRDLIGDMVNLHHIQTNHVLVERDTFSLRELVSQIAEEYAELIKDKKIILTQKFAPDDNPLNIEADRQKTYLVFANLLSNAIKFTQDGGRIHINIQLKGYEYWINVIDTGIGIPDLEFKKIFDQFYQVEPSLSRKYQGMGLGLSIAKGMVELHQGRIWVESVVSKGSNFTVVLPTAPDVRAI